MSSLSILMTVNKVTNKVSLQLAACILVLWTIGLHLFWYLMIPPKEGEGGGRGRGDNLTGTKATRSSGSRSNNGDSSNNGSGSGSSSSSAVNNSNNSSTGEATLSSEGADAVSEGTDAVSEGWKQKVRTRDEDRRLPTTIVTGFLVSGEHK
jgi:hypothetical protein